MRPLRAVWDWLGRFAESPRNLLLLDIALGLAVAVLAFVFVFYSRQTHDALCNFRTDLERRVTSTEKFLADHPGDLHLGTITIPREQLVAQITSQRATLKSLDELNC